MPIYEFGCGECGHQLERLQKMSDEPPQCPSCDAKMKKKFPSRTSFALKGSGWGFDNYGAKDVTYGQNGGGRGMSNINTSTKVLKDF